LPLLAAVLLVGGVAAWPVAAAVAPWQDVKQDRQLRHRLSLLSRQAAQAYFAGKTYQPRPVGIPVQGGLFVTLAQRGRDGRLQTRACWGSLQPEGGDLATAISQTAVAALTQDYRQPPVQPSELDKVRFVVSLVGPLSAVPTGERLQPLREGLYLTDGTRGAVLLPGEALTSSWQEATCRQKAGIPARAPVYRYRFQTLVIEEPQP
jgi:AMMECR1 domain-containing protein